MIETNPAAPPDYPYCGRGADTGGEDPVGCRGRRVRRPVPDAGGDEPEPYGACLAHLTDTDRDAYLAAVRPGSELHHPGTILDAALLDRLLDAIRDPATGQLRLGDADFRRTTFEDDAVFERATFEGVAVFEEVTFEGEAVFRGVTFQGDAEFDGATFQGEAVFSGVTFQAAAGFLGATFQAAARFSGATFQAAARFSGVTFQAAAGFLGATFQRVAGFRDVTFPGDARFSEVTFQDDAQFSRVTFQGNVWFGGVTFERRAMFNEATFGGDASFGDATFHGNAVFHGATFEHASRVGPVACRGTADFSAAVFGAAVIVEVAARDLDCRRTLWASTAALRLRHAAVDLSDAVLEYPVSVTAQFAPFRWGPRAPDPEESGIDPAPVRMLSLRGVDAAHLTLTDIDLTECRFAGTVHLDQLRLYGRCPLSRAPGGWHRRGLLPVHLTARQTLAEEQHWRATRAGAAAGWTPPPDGSAPLEPAALVPLYRELRKAFEDGKNEPGAADFYYGEMEMRRHDPRTPAAELFLLRLYWALSGYGLRASRALGWLLAAMFTTVVLMMLWGLPKEAPEPVSTGTVDGRSVTLTTDTPAPQNPDSPYGERLSTERFDPALRVVINSVVFRSSGQDLTTFGTYTEMASRFTEPVLLGLAALAIRNRVKR